MKKDEDPKELTISALPNGLNEIAVVVAAAESLIFRIAISLFIAEYSLAHSTAYFLMPF
jgi:hypothetical protein